MTLRRCFCGGEAKSYPFDYPDAFPEELRHINCATCGFSTVSYANGNEARRAWNRLMRERDSTIKSVEKMKG